MYDFIILFTGMVSIEGWPKWYQADWWFPLALSLIGTFANFSLVKIIIAPNILENSGNRGTQMKSSLTNLIFIKISTEALILLVCNANDTQLYETNVILAVLLFITCFLIVCFCPNKYI